MTDEANNGGAGGQGGEGAPPAAGSEASAPPEWMAGLSEDLRGNETLSRYKSIDEFARGHLETKKAASSKIVLPGEGADEAALGAFYDAIGRPESPDKYDVAVPDGMPTEFADAFRQTAHKLGLRPEQAKGIAEWNNAMASAQLEAGATEVAALKAETPDYDRKLAAAQAAAKRFGMTPALADELDAKMGSRGLVEFFINMGEALAEAPRIDGKGAEPFGADLRDAGKQLDALQANPEFRKKILDKDPAALQQRQRLLDAATRQAKPA